MFTIKHVSPTGGETIYSANDVTFSPEIGDYVGSQLPGRSYSPATVWYGDAGSLEPLTGGVVYVMNAAGATVAKYNLAPVIVGGLTNINGIGVSEGIAAGLTAASAQARAA